MDLKEEIKKFFKGDVEDSDESLTKYSRDASLLEVRPELVVFPKDSEDLKSLVKLVDNNKDKYPYEQKELFQAGEILFKYFVGVFLQTYTEVAQAGNLNIGYRKEIDFLLKYCLLEKAVYELGYELNSRPRWAVIPLTGIASIMEFKEN